MTALAEREAIMALIAETGRRLASSIVLCPLMSAGKVEAICDVLIKVNAAIAKRNNQEHLKC